MTSLQQKKDVSVEPLLLRPTHPAAAAGGIRAVHVNKARDMVALHVKGRLPPEARAAAAATAARLPSKDSTMSIKHISVPAKSHKGECHNPQCEHCGVVIIPSPQSLFPIQDQPSITINDWSIYTSKKPILNSAELDYYAEHRFDFPLPEMIFGNSYVRIVNDKTGGTIEINPIDALATLDSDCQYKVSYHQEWLSSRRLKQSNLLEKSEKALKENSNKDIAKLTEPLEEMKPYDWTYTPNYKGTVKGFVFSPSSDPIPLTKLQRRDPILFYDESVLFEDELGDNGISLFFTKIRVMRTCLLLLCRFFLRIDDVIFKIRDSRIYIDLELNVVMREYKEQELPYDELAAKVGKTGKSSMSDPKKYLRDLNWVAENIPVVKSTVERCQVVYEE